MTQGRPTNYKLLEVRLYPLNLAPKRHNRMHRDRPGEARERQQVTNPPNRSSEHLVRQACPNRSPECLIVQTAHQNLVQTALQNIVQTADQNIKIADYNISCFSSSHLLCWWNDTSTNSCPLSEREAARLQTRGYTQTLDYIRYQTLS